MKYLFVALGFLAILGIIKLYEIVTDLCYDIYDRISQAFNAIRGNNVDRRIQNRPGNYTSSINQMDRRDEHSSQYPTYFD